MKYHFTIKKHESTYRVTHCSQVGRLGSLKVTNVGLYRLPYTGLGKVLAHITRSLNLQILYIQFTGVYLATVHEIITPKLFFYKTHVLCFVIFFGVVIS